MKRRLEALLAEYGKIALGTYLTLFVVAMVGFSAAIGLGFEVDSATSGAGTLGAAWVATKLTQPLRIAATLVLTPLVGRLLGVRGRDKAVEVETPAE